MNEFKTWLEKQKYVIIDGAMSTPLEQKGLELNHKLWTAKVLLDKPEKITEVHREYFEAGANVAITASYQASILGFTDLGFSEKEAEELIRKTVKLAKTARDEVKVPQKMWVAGSVGPYGAYLADGSEYRGDYNVDSEFLREFHEKRIELLLEEGVDLLAIETIPNFEEIKVLLEILKQYPNAVAWVTCSLRDSEHISDGTSLLDVQKFLESNEQIVAYGVNCVKPELVDETIKLLSKNNKKELIVYPNGGAVYNPEIKEWSSSEHAEHLFRKDALEWYNEGCHLIGGCCCTNKTDIEVLSENLTKNVK